MSQRGAASAAPPAAPAPAPALAYVFGREVAGRAAASAATAAGAVYSSYRRNLSSRLVPSLRSDAGWGCTVRSMQMLLASAVVRAGGARAAAAALIADGDDAACAFSLPRLLHAAAAAPGTWFGPHAAASWLLRGAGAGADAGAGAGAGAGAPALCFVLCCDATVARDEVRAVACAPSVAAAAAALEYGGAGEGGSGGGGGVSWQPTLALLPLRLGLGSAIEARYLPLLCALLRLPAFAGAVGGTPRHSLFFVGEERGAFLYLDPHTTQEAARPAAAAQAEPGGPEAAAAAAPSPTFEGARAVGGCMAARLPLQAAGVASAAFVASCEAPAPGRMPAASLDPTITLAFLFACEAELDAFCGAVRQLTQPGALPAWPGAPVIGGGTPRAAAAAAAFAGSFIEVVDRRPAGLDDAMLRDMEVPSSDSEGDASSDTAAMAGRPAGASIGSGGGGGGGESSPRRSRSAEGARRGGSAAAGASFFGFSLSSLFSLFSLGSVAAAGPPRRAKSGSGGAGRSSRPRGRVAGVEPAVPTVLPPAEVAVGASADDASPPPSALPPPAPARRSRGESFELVSASPRSTQAPP